MRPIVLLRLLAFLAAGSLPVQAQSPAPATPTTSARPAIAAASGTAAASARPAAENPGPSVSVNFKTFAINKAVQGVYFRSGGAVMSLSAQPLTTSNNSYAYSGPAKMEILKPDSKAAAAAPDASATPAPADAAASGGSGRGGRGGRGAPGQGRGGRGGNGGAPAGPMTAVSTVTFPRSGNYILFMAADDAGNAVGVPLTNDAKDFPIGSVRLVNVTNYPLDMTLIGDEKFNLDIKAYDSAVYHPKGADPFIAQFHRTDIAGTDTVLGGQYLPPASGQRTSIFIYVGNAAQVKNEGQAPAFATLINNDTPTTTSFGAPGRGGPGGSGRGGAPGGAPGGQGRRGNAGGGG